MMVRNKWMRSSAAAACLLGLVLAIGCGSSSSGGQSGGGSGSQSGSGSSSKTITYASNSFSDDRSSTALATAILERAGYKVSPQLLGSVGLDFAAVAKGSADVYSDAWLPHTHGQYWTQYGSKLQKISKLYPQQVNNVLAVPKYCPAQSIDQLNQQASKYGSKIIGIEPGAGEMILTKKALGTYGLNFTLVPGSETAMLASLKKAISQHQCVVVTLWRPHSAFAQFPIRALKDPKGVYPPDYAWTVANPSFQKDYPNPYAFFQHFTIPIPQQEQIIRMIVNEGKSPSAAANAWIQAHQQTAQAWVKLARG